jgi:hypothetical protein
VTDVFVDVAAALIEGDREPTPDPEAVHALELLLSAHLRVVLVDGNSGRVPDALGAVARGGVVAAVPPRPNVPAWYLTSELARCRGTSARLRTVLIGAAPPRESVRRCDAVARDLQAAVMEVLAEEAMPAKL